MIVKDDEGTKKGKWNKMRIGIIAGIIPLLGLIGFGAPHSAFAFGCHATSDKCYNDGWNAGVNDAMLNWDNNQGYDPLCPSGHSDIYCSGYTNGYNHWWNSAQNLNTKTSQGTEQEAGVNIKGNNNKVTINQGSSEQVGNNGGSSGSSGHGQNPRCIILCSAIRVK
jgi:hypothetical protein